MHRFARSIDLRELTGVKRSSERWYCNVLSKEHAGGIQTVLPRQLRPAVMDTEQWVHTIESCSYRSNVSQAIPRGTGVEKLCRATDDNFGEKYTIDYGYIVVNGQREETLVVSFAREVFINAIRIYESLNPGSIVKLEMLDSARGNR